MIVQAGAGVPASFTDDAYTAAGATIGSPADALGADMVLKVRTPVEQELALMKRGTVLVGMLNPSTTTASRRMNAAGLTAFALEAAPRTTRAQSMDVLSSQANIAGYKAVMMAAERRIGRFMPMLMTAAGTVKAARVLILGAGVAGLQAIATAKRLGAVIEASDVRPAVKEQVESLGAKFVDVPYETDEEREIAKGVGGYARPMPPAGCSGRPRRSRERAEAGRHRHHHRADPGPPGADADHRGDGQGDEARLGDRRPGGGAGRQLRAVRTRQDGRRSTACTIIGAAEPPGARCRPTRRALYARNVLDFLKLVIAKDGNFTLPPDDDIVAACLMCTGGEIKRKN